MCVVVINHDEQEDILYNINHITQLHYHVLQVQNYYWYHLYIYTPL